MFFIAFILAFCSLFYELLFSQMISVFIGNTILSYSLAIGVFVLALGFGSILCDRWPGSKTKYTSHSDKKINASSDETSSLKLLFFIEIALSLLGLLGGYIEFFLAQATTHFPFSLRFIALLLPVFVIGTLSGFELPLLMKAKQNMNEKFYVLSADYSGMFVSALLFPVLFFWQGLFKSFIIISFINLLVAYALLPKNKKHIVEKLILLAIGVFAILLWVFTPLNTHLSLLKLPIFFGGAG